MRVVCQPHIIAAQFFGLVQQELLGATERGGLAVIDIPSMGLCAATCPISISANTISKVSFRYIMQKLGEV